jgi:hypothetical protein
MTDKSGGQRIEFDYQANALTEAHLGFLAKVFMPDQVLLNDDLINVAHSVYPGIRFPGFHSEQLRHSNKSKFVEFQKKKYYFNLRGCYCLREDGPFDASGSCDTTYKYFDRDPFTGLIIGWKTTKWRDYDKGNRLYQGSTITTLSYDGTSNEDAKIFTGGYYIRNKDFETVVESGTWKTQLFPNSIPGFKMNQIA